MSNFEAEISPDAVREALEGFDGRATTIPAEVNARFGDGSNFVAVLIQLLGDDDGMLASAATWILLDRQQAGHLLGADQVQALVEMLQACKADKHHWSTQLHVCQMIRFLPLDHLSDDEIVILSGWLRPHLIHERPFLRAWALDAFMALSTASPELAREAKAALDRALSDNAASVRSRARKLLSK